MLFLHSLHRVLYSEKYIQKSGRKKGCLFMAYTWAVTGLPCSARTQHYVGDVLEEGGGSERAGVKAVMIRLGDAGSCRERSLPVLGPSPLLFRPPLAVDFPASVVLDTTHPSERRTLVAAALDHSHLWCASQRNTAPALGQTNTIKLDPS